MYTYRAILREHRKSLPIEMSSLGNKFAEHEFRLHRKATPKQAEEFFNEWESYLVAIRSQNLGKDIDTKVESKMSAEQRAKMQELKDEIFK